MTLKQLCDQLGIHPYDLTGDEEWTDNMLDEDITDTIFYQEILDECNSIGIKLINK